MSEVFVFQRGNRFIRLPLYQLLLVSNVHEHLMPILESSSADVKPVKAEADEVDAEVAELIHTLEESNLSRLIDVALADRNEELFYDLMTQKEKLNGGYAV